jgi:2-polyprenyl-3-methyl-5-hydroxy-6-metoxy-1,4-benzoquinol methylase
MAHTDHLAPATSDSSRGIATCLCCGGDAKIRDHLPHLWHQRVDSPPYDLHWCEHCDFGFLYPRPSQEDLARFARDSRELRRDWPDLIPLKPTFLERVRVHLAWRASYGFSKIDARQIQEFAGSRFISICVFGGGLGDMMRQLKDTGHRVVGIDVDEAAPGLAQTRGLVVYNGSIEEPPAAILAEPFDIVVLSSVLGCCSDPRRALQMVQELLKPGGHLMAEVPNHGAYSARRLGPAWFFCDAGNSLNFFTSRSLSRFVETCGFEIIDLIYNNYTGQFRNSRLAVEQKIWDHLYANVDPRAPRLPRRKSRWELWRGLLGSMFRSAAEKYEVVGIIGKKRDD